MSLLKPAPKPRRSKVWLLLLGVVPPFVSALVILFTGARLARFARFDSEWDKLLIGVVTGVIAGIVGSVVMGRMRSRNSSGLFQP